MKALFSPDTIALIGASGDPAKNTARPQLYLRKHGYKGRVFPINPTRSEVLGEQAWPDLKSATEAAGSAIEHAYVMVPKAAVEGVIDDCVAAGVKVASIYSDGFAETGADGLEAQQKLVGRARQGGLRLIGPNSMGAVNVQAGMAMTTNAGFEAPALIPGPFSVISQSGTALGGLLSRGQARGFGFSKLLSIGTESDLSVGEVTRFLVDDDDTGAILLFLETLRFPDHLAAAARAARAAGKPVIAYKLGRSDAGRQMAVSHSGALAGPDEAADAFFRHHGILRVDTLEALLEVPFLAMGRAPSRKRAAAPRVAVMSTTGGGAAMVVDRLGLAGVEFAAPPESVVDKLSEHGIRTGSGPIVDLTMVGARPDVYGPVLRGLIDDADCDAVVCVVGSSAQFRPDVAVGPILAEGKGDKPVAVFCVPEATETLKVLADEGFAGFRTPESCADALAAFFHWHLPPSEDAGDFDPAPVEALLGEAKDEEGALKVFQALGVHAAPFQILKKGETTTGIDFPVAAKVLSGDIAHKTEAGGVVLNIENEAGLSAAVEKIFDNAQKAHPTADINGVLVQAMQSGLAEVLIGYRLDAEAGPVVVLGMGGVLTEITGDACVRLAPVNLETAHEMIAAVRGLAGIRGYRNLPQGDLDALADAVRAVSRLALIEGGVIKEAEINPLIVKPKGEGVAAVDGLIVMEEGR
ncbi:MAG: acetate--CoA ligase family protein [Proteobacteria bacterium]|nr:acetate--CoA ligase family protein [Pseudomonadota bacterium]MDA1024041.1 acetate--CoA ligase family protein [Pseudomonadota bacterium]